MPIRSFICVEIDDAIRAALADAQQALAGAGGQVRWSKPENVHVTLKFLGDIAEENVGAACRIVKSVAGGYDAFDITVAGFGAFPNWRRPRVVFAHVDDPTGALAKLTKAFEREMTAIGVKREKRPFRSHLTLGRVKPTRGIDGLAAAVAERGDETFGSQAVGEVVLMRSELRPAGPIYSRLGVGKLKA